MHYAAESMHWNAGRRALKLRAACTKLSLFTLTRIKENISCNLCANKELSSLESTAPTATNIIEFSLGKTSTVSGHPNLPSGHKPSEKQLEIAKSLGINLADNQTYVTDYSRKIA